jgi:YHS domain-containing protein
MMPEEIDQSISLPVIQKLVCGRDMTIPAENYYHAEYQGRRIYFCTEFCLETFRADPERFYNAHSRRKGNSNPAIG